MNNRRARILVVDDDKGSRDVLCAVFEQVGYAAHGAANGLEAIRCLEAAPYGAVVTDYHMPRMDGLQLLGVVRCRWPDTPVIVVSGDLPDTAKMAVQRGAYAWVPKPFELSQVLATVCSAVQGMAAPGNGCVERKHGT